MKHPSHSSPKWAASFISLALLILTGAFLPTAIQQHGLDHPEAIGAYLNGNLPDVPPSSTSAWTVEHAFPHLTFVDPIQMLEVPGANRFLVAGKKGTLWTFEKDTATTSKEVLLDIEHRVQTSADEGLLGVVFHPAFHVPGSPHEGYFYVFYRYKFDPEYQGSLGYYRLSRFQMTPGTFHAPASSEYVLIQQFDRHEWHNGGGMFFDEKGLLYFSVGDEGGSNDQFGTTQQIDRGLLSGVFRIDVDRDSSRSHPIRRQPANPQTPPAGWPDSFSQGYLVPDDNPWQNANGGVLEEFFAIGLRSPHRMSYDAQTGSIWLGDVGQSGREEIDRIVKGGNYQWPYREGSNIGPKARPNPLIGTDEAPFYDYGRSQGNCVIGGFVYHGAKWASSLEGLYLFGDHGTRNIWTLNPDDADPQESFLVNVPGGGVGNQSGISTFATDSAGEVYVLKLFGTNLDGGHIYKLAAATTTPEPPTLLSQTGAFKNMQTLEPQEGLIPYGLNVPFWSDGAAKLRWMAIPNDGTHDSDDEQVTFSPTSEWQFPKGSVFIKHFEYPADDHDPGITRRLETRFLVHASNGRYYGMTYRWRPDQNDAELLDGGWNDTLSIRSENGDREIIWQYPDRQQCRACHTRAAGAVLGPKTRQLNGDFFYEKTGKTANQLMTLAHLGIFSAAVDTHNLEGLLTSAPSHDPTYSLHDRARAYLDANCASCHRPGNAVRAHFDARLSTPMNQAGIVYGELQSSLGLTGMREVIPQDPEHSMMYLRMRVVHENFAMPPLAKNEVDSSGVQLIFDWINSLDPNLNWTGAGKANQRIAFAPLRNRNTSDPADLSFPLQATASSGLPVRFQVVEGPATLDGNQISLTGQTGRVIVRATQGGNGSVAPAPAVARTWWVTPPGYGTGTGLKGNYFDEPDFLSLKFARIDSQIDFHWGAGSPGAGIRHNTFSVMWEGFIEAPYSETFTFTARADDGVRLWVDEQLVIDAWDDQPLTQHSGSIAMQAWRRVPIRLAYYQQNVYASVRLSWASASLPKEVVPAAFLYPAPGIGFFIELLDFDAIPEGDRVLLNWETASEQNSAHFVVERSQDGTIFQDLLKVGAAGNSFQVRSYRAQDARPLRGNSYYRLRSVDIDGKFAYSAIRSVVFSGNMIRLFPNPLASDKALYIELDFESTMPVSLWLIDAQGRVVQNQRIQMLAPRHREAISLAHLSAGIYFVRMRMGEQQVVKKIVIP